MARKGQQQVKLFGPPPMVKVPAPLVELQSVLKARLAVALLAAGLLGTGCFLLHRALGWFPVFTPVLIGALLAFQKTKKIAYDNSSFPLTDYGVGQGQPMAVVIPMLSKVGCFSLFAALLVPVVGITAFPGVGFFNSLDLALALMILTFFLAVGCQETLYLYVGQGEHEFYYGRNTCLLGSDFPGTRVPVGPPAAPKAEAVAVTARDSETYTVYLLDQGQKPRAYRSFQSEEQVRAPDLKHVVDAEADSLEFAQELAEALSLPLLDERKSGRTLEEIAAGFKG